MSQCPLVSIIIPVYNGSDYLDEAISSALAQTYPNVEVIVIDDGSDDQGKTEQIAKAYGERIRYFRKENGGVSSALNLGIQLMRGDYFSWLSHDDIYCEEKIEAEVKALLADGGDGSPERKVAYCNFSLIDSQSKPVPNHKAYTAMQRSLTAKEALHVVLKNGSLNGCAFLIPRKLFEECGGFDESLRYAQDALMWYQMFARGYSLTVVPQTLVKNRIHQKQQTQTGRHRYAADCSAICNIILPVFDAISTAEEDFVYEYALHHSMRQNGDVVRRCTDVLKQAGRFSCRKRIRIGLMGLYGKVRPMFRRIYYKVFRGVATR